MRLSKYVKSSVALVLAATLAFALNGCGGGKKEAKKFSVPADKLPTGVVSIIRPMPNKETLFVRALVQEAIRRNRVAMLYNKALIHYDPEKGNATEHEKLLKKVKQAWNSARDAASVATFYAIGLSQLERTEGYDPYKKTAMLTVPEIRLMPVAYAKEDKKLNSKEEVFSKYSPQLIRNDLKKVPEGKQLLAISKMYHTNGSTACDIMNTINPNYQQTGRSFKDIANDVGYRVTYPLKVAGKAAMTGLAAVGLVKAAPVLGVKGTLVGAHMIGVGVVDTLIDTLQAGHVIFTGEEHPEIKKGLIVSETASSIVSLCSFDLSKPMMGNHGIKFKDSTNLFQKVKGYVSGSVSGASKFTKNIKNYTEGTKNYLMNLNGNVPKGSLTLATKQLVVSEGNLNAMSVTTGILTLLPGTTDNNKTSDENKTMNNQTAMISSSLTDDGRIETRTGLLSKKNKDKMTDKEKAEEKEKAEALGTTLDEIEDAEKAAMQKEAAVATATSQELEKGAEEVANAGGGSQYKELYNTIIDGTRKGLLESVLGSGASMDDLDKWISKIAGEEMKATQLIVSTDEQGNVKDIKVVAQKKDTTPPFAPAKVAGKYKVPYSNSTLNFTVTAQGENIIIEYQFARNNVMTKRREKPAAYDPQTGKGTFAVEGSTCPFWFTNSNGKMSMGVGKWKKVKKQ